MRNETKIGIFAVVGIIILFVGLKFLKGSEIFSRTNTFYSTYTNVEGLLPGNPVMLQGLQVGLVSEVELDKERPGKILVEFTVQNDLSIPADTKAEITGMDFLGAMGLFLKSGKSSTYKESGDFIDGTVNKGMIGSLEGKIDPLTQKIESIVNSVDSITMIFKDVVKKEDGEKLKREVEESLTDFRNLLKNLNSATYSLNTMLKNNNESFTKTMSNVEELSTELANNKEQLTATLKNTEEFTQSLTELELQETVAQLDKTLKSFDEVLVAANNPNGSIGKLLHEDGMYKNLEGLTSEMEALMKDLKENPQRYIRVRFGKGKDYKEEDNK